MSCNSYNFNISKVQIGAHDEIHFDACVSACICVSPKVRAATANFMMRDQFAGCAI